MQKFITVFFTLILIHATCNLIFAETKIIAAEGKFVMGDLDSKSNAKKIALLNAKQMAMEAAGTYLTSLSKVENYALTHDEISSLSAGIIAVEIIDEKWSMEGESPVITITIEAKIEPDGLDDRIKTLQENGEFVEEYKNIQTELSELKKELATLKDQEKSSQASGSKTSVEKESLSQERQLTINRLIALEDVKTASLELNKGDAETAINNLTGAIKLNPNNSLAFIKRAQAYAKLGQYQDASKDIDTALKINPKSDQAYGLRGRIFLDRGNARQAVIQFSKAIQLKEKGGLYYYFRGIAHMELKQRRPALVDFNIACKYRVRDGCLKARQLNNLREKDTKK